VNARLRRAAFLDRDGTLIKDAHYIRDPADVELLPGVTGALERLQKQGFALVVITNQSGIARGMLTEADYEAVRARLDALLAEKGVTLTASYHCPHLPDITGPCECRKPGTLLHRTAAADHGLDLALSVFIGDRWRDVSPAVEFGARGYLIPGPNTTAEDRELSADARDRVEFTKDIESAAALVVGPLQG
jgi:D-glycero-D-manno-heptose 1,7-bisphosphate phosphatase